MITATFRFDKKILFGILLLVAVLILISCEIFTHASPDRPAADTTEARVGFLQSLGYEVDLEKETVSQILIPETFSDVYEKYNALQKQAGFDLHKYAGKQAELYTYAVIGEENVTATLIVIDGCVIGGDIASSKIDGTMYPLIHK